MIGSKKHAVLLFSALLISGCAKFKVPPLPEQPVQQAVPVELPITVLHKADYNIDDSLTVKRFKVLGSDTEYQTELARLSVEVTRPVDFLQSRVVVSTMGTQPAGGYVISAIRASEYAERVVVTVELKSPGAACVNTAALSNPYEFVLIPTTKPIEFTELPLVNDCL